MMREIAAGRLAGAFVDVSNTSGEGRRETRIFRDCLRMLRRHKLLFAVCVLLPLVGGVSVALLQPPVYLASSSVVIDTSGKDVVTLRNVLSDVSTDNEAITGELELLSSRELLEKVATKLSLLDNKEFNPALRTSLASTLIAEGKTALRRWLPIGREAPDAEERRPINDVVEALRDHLLITPVGRSRVIRITSTAKDPAVAAAIVNTLATTYTEEHLRLRNDARRQANDWISARLTDLRTKADESATAVEAYRAAHGLARGRDSLLIQQQATEASTQLTTARVRVAEARSRLSDAELALKANQPGQIASVLSSLAIQQLRQQESELAARRANLLANSGASHPSVIAAQAQLRVVQGQIAAETSRIVASLRDAVRIAESQEVELGRHLAKTRNDVDEASAQDVPLKELQRVADADNSLYQTFLTRARETGSEVAFPTVNVRVLSTAVPPNRPVSPNKPRLVAAGGVLGLILGSLMVLARDMTSRGLRTSADVERLTGMAPFGAIPFCRRRSGALERLRFEEAVASLWTRIFISGSEAAPRSVVITSAVTGEGKTQLARALCAVAARQGQRVLLVDSDLRCSSMTAGFASFEGKPGLYEVLRGEKSLRDVIVAENQRVHVLPSGCGRENPVRLLASSRFTALLQQAEAAYDLVIFDSPPVMIAADAWWLSRSAQMTLLLARWGRTPESAVRAAGIQLFQCGVRNLKVVLSVVDADRLPLYEDATMLGISMRAPQYYRKYLARQ